MYRLSREGGLWKLYKLQVRVIYLIGCNLSCCMPKKKKKKTAGEALGDFISLITICKAQKLLDGLGTYSNYSLTIMVTGRQGIHCLMLVDKLVQGLSLCCATSHLLISVHRHEELIFQADIHKLMILLSTLFL